MKKLLGIILTLLAVVAVADAQSCGVRSYTPYYQPTYQAPYYPPVVNVAQLAVFPVLVPSFTVGIQQPVVVQQAAPIAQQPQAVVGVDAELQALRRENRALRQDNADLRGQPLPAADPMPLAQPIASGSLSKNCASCHSAANKNKGGGVVLDGVLSADDRLAVIDAVLSGRMPKGSKLIDQDAAEIVQSMTARKK